MTTILTVLIILTASPMLGIWIGGATYPRFNSFAIVLLVGCGTSFAAGLGLLVGASKVGLI